jgi:hypothetical protein
MENTALNLKKVKGANQVEDSEREEISARHERKIMIKLQKLLEFRNRQRRVEDHWE